MSRQWAHHSVLDANFNPLVDSISFRAVVQADGLFANEQSTEWQPIGSNVDMV